MCGIFGFIAAPGAKIDTRIMRSLLDDFFHLSEPRGQEASGLAISAGGEIRVFKRNLPPAIMLKNHEYQRFLENSFKAVTYDDANTLTSPVAIMGHCRLVTNGVEIVPGNNQPVLTEHSVGIHNGIITNDSVLWKDNPHLKRLHDTDSEILFRLMDDAFDQSNNLALATKDVFEKITGSASTAVFRNDLAVLGLASNTGSLYFREIPQSKIFVFASEKFILQTFLKNQRRALSVTDTGTQQLKPGQACNVSFSSVEVDRFELCSETSPKLSPNVNHANYAIIDRSNRVSEIKRCSKCVLPATYPFIEFDAQGICQHCRAYKPLELAGADALERTLDKYRSKDGSPDCIVAFSGGRDSSYGLHLLKTRYEMNPVAYTYDWGMVTGIARRNQARILGKLGVEHILRAADIPAKRRYMRKNIQAWLKKPHLGMVPLFMAGDKFFYDIGRQLRTELNLDLVIFCAGNELERTDFKGGFAGIRESQHGQRLFAFSLWNKISIALFYAFQYARNPAYINESLIESLHAFRSSFIAKDDFLYLFHYLDWDEKIIDQTLKDEYDWETAEHTENTWRIGDGYTSFINYIFYTVAGFSEFDTFRSNQIRKGLITRGEAMQLIEQENQPDLSVLYEFAQQIGINLEEVLTKINTIKKLY